MPQHTGGPAPVRALEVVEGGKIVAAAIVGQEAVALNDDINRGQSEVDRQQAEIRKAALADHRGAETAAIVASLLQGAGAVNPVGLDNGVALAPGCVGSEVARAVSEVVPRP